MSAPAADGARLREDYERELRYLRNAGAAFARNHPDVAARLELSNEGSADPHVERLLEGFAFLAARLHRTFDESTSSLAATLLEQLFPHAARPLPSSTIVHVDTDSAGIDLGAGYELARGSAMFVDTADGATIRFQSRYPLTLWPLRVTHSVLLTERLDDLSRHPDKRSVLSLRLAFPPGFDPGAANLGRLRFHVKGANEAAARLCDLLYAHTLEVRWRDGAGRGALLGCLPRFVGLGVEEALLPEHDDTHPGLRLLLEYFACPAKFQFFELDCAELGRSAGVPPGPWAEPWCELLFVLGARPVEALELEPDAVMLGCTPVLNLFARTSEPVRVDGTRSQYKLVPDVHRERATEIYSIEEVAAIAPGERAAVLPRFFGFHGGDAQDTREPARPVCWHARRGPPFKASLGGTDMRLLLVDPACDPAVPATRTLLARLLCTNRGLAETLPAGTRLVTEDAGAIGAIRMLHAPSRQSLAQPVGAARWQLVSQLSLNHLSLVEGPEALSRLKELLALNNLGGSVVADRQIGALAALRCRRVTRHVGGDPWHGYRRGYALTLRLAPGGMRGSSICLFGAVLQRFLALYAGINTFVELTLEHDDGRVAGHWDALASAQLAL